MIHIHSVTPVAIYNSFTVVVVNGISEEKNFYLSVYNFIGFAFEQNTAIFIFWKLVNKTFANCATKHYPGCVPSSYDETNNTKFD